MLAIVLAFAGSISFGAADFLAGVKARELRVLPVVVVAQFGGLLALAPIVLVVGGLTADGTFWLFSALAGLGQLIGVTAFWRGLTVGAMGVVAPISASSALLPVAVGLAQGERPAAVQLVGIALAIVGVALTAYEPPSADRERRRVAAGVGLALIAAVGVGLFPVAIDAASEEGTALGAVVASRVCSCVVVATAVLVLRRRLGLVPAQIPPLAAVGVLEMIGLFLVATATTYGLLAIVGAISALYPVTTVGLAWLVLNERLHRVQRQGAAVAMVGIVAVTAASS
jgi:drug/metabolite transporter (DMT)-like permease